MSNEGLTAGVYIGSDKTAVEAMQAAILAILGTAVDNETKRVALKVLKGAVTVKNVNMSNVSVTGPMRTDVPSP